MRRRVTAAAVALGLVAVHAGCTASLPVDGERMLARVRHQVEAGPRVVGTPGHAAIRDWIAAELARMGAKVERQTFTDSTLGRPLEITNVIGRYGPEGVRRVVLCGHYDTRPWCDRDPDTTYRNQPVPGANDGGSSVAVLLEIAELLGRRSPRVGIDLVFFDAEDLGTDESPEQYCLGSRGYAARLPAPGDVSRPVAAFLFDMIGDADLDIYPERNSLARAANLVAMVLQGARATGARSFHDEARWVLLDDHIPLNEAGLPAVDIIDFDYPAWHTHRDTPGQLSAASLAEVARVAAWIAYDSPLARP